MSYLSTNASPTFNYLGLVGTASPTVAFGNTTLACWARLTNLATASEIIEINDSNGTAFFSAAITMNGSNVAFHVTNSAGTRVSLNPAGAIVVNTWTHLALTWDGTNIRGYANGVLVAGPTAGPAGPFGNWRDLQVGPAVGDLQDAVFYAAALTIDEIAQLYRVRQPLRRDQLKIHLPIFPGSTNWARDYSGNGYNFSNQGTPADSTVSPPQVSWGDDGTQVILLPDGATTIVPSGLTQTTGSATLTAAAGLVASGLTRTTGAATMTAAAGLVASGLTQTTGAAAMTAAAALVASGLTRTTGAASFGSATFPIIATGTTQTTGTAAMTAAAALAASGVTQTTGTATMTAAAALVASGVTQTSGSATLAGSLIASGLTQTTGAATFGSVTFPIVATGLTRTTGTAALTAAAALAASGVTQTTGAATFGSATFPVIAAGLTTTTGAAAMGAVVPVVDVPQRFIRAPRETIWITTSPFQPQSYQSILGDKLLEMWHAENGIALDGSSNVQSWAGQMRGFALGNTLGAAFRPNYGVDAAFGAGKNVVQAKVAGPGPRCLAYRPGSTIFTITDRPAIVHVSRYVTVPDGSSATNLVNMGKVTGGLLNDFFDGTIVTTGQRRRVVRTTTHVSPFGQTIFEDPPVTTTPRMVTFGITGTTFEVWIGTQRQGALDTGGENLSEVLDQLTVGAQNEAGASPSDSNYALILLCSRMPNQFEIMQLYGLAKAEWSGI